MTQQRMNAVILERMPIDAGIVVEIGSDSDRFRNRYPNRNPSVTFHSFDTVLEFIGSGKIADALVLRGALPPVSDLVDLGDKLAPDAVLILSIPTEDHAKQEIADRGEKAGYKIEQLISVVPPKSTKLKNNQQGHWLSKLRRKPAARPKTIFAIGIGTQIDALSTIRLRQPLQGLNTSGAFKSEIQIGHFGNVDTKRPDILLSYRLHPNPKSTKSEVDQMCRDGVLFIHDVDDHPEYLKGQKANNYWSIRGAHAITASTPELLETCKKWNPNVHLVPNQILETSPPARALAPPKGKPKLFFGALNREDEWKAQCDGILAFLNENPDRLACKVLHEPSLSDALSETADCEFVPTQNYAGFINQLAECDIAISPLFETEFNACKSDLKLIECLAHGVVPICSAYAAAQTTIPNEFLMIADEPANWATHLETLCAHPETLAQRKADGFDWVRKNRMWSIHAPALSALYQSLLEDLPRLERERRARLGKDVTV